jgi:peptidoglycan/xylan/chitin deacetylase (PgdA/CDA1 family)
MRDEVYSADRSLKGKLRRRLSKLLYRKPAKLEALKRPLITFSFDDAPQSAAEAGLEILERHNIKATYFISAGLMGQDSHFGTYTSTDHVKALSHHGHEIACHTFTHLDCGIAKASEIAENLEQNQMALHALGIPPLETFAYPYGDVSLDAKAILNKRFLASRALHHGIIKTGTDLNQAPAVGIEGESGESLALTFMQKTHAQEQAWLVLYTHDVRPNPSQWGCTPDTLETLIKAAISMDFEIVSFVDGAKRC